MDKEKLGHDPAFPVLDPNIALALFNSGSDPTGMSKRFYVACAAMQGLLSHYGNFGELDTMIQWSYEYADEFLKYENL